jgi:hypothetical protein
MERKKVTSSQLKSIGFDPISQTMEVEFTPTKKQTAAGEPGSIYQYSNVAPGDAARLTKAESIGSHFIKVIKADPERFPFKKIS